MTNQVGLKLVGLVLVTLMSLTSFAQSTTTLPDLFLEIPDSSLPFNPVGADGKALTRETKKKLVKLHDAKNGYLELYNPVTREQTAEGIWVENSLVENFDTAQIAKFFRTGKKSWFLGMSSISGDHTTGIRFLERRDGVWSDITHEVLPELTPTMVNDRARKKIKSWADKQYQIMDGASGTYRYLMPRKGTTLIVETACDCPDIQKPVTLWSLRFDGSRFHLDP